VAVSVDLRLGDCLDVLREIPANSVDAILADPPAGISFMGRSWDSDKGGRDQWVAWLTEVMGECLRVIKPGGHALVWALPRTSHWTGWALESAGWQIRDRIAHQFYSGFPKSLDVSKAIDTAAGATREVVGRKTYAGGHIQNSTDPGRAMVPGGAGMCKAVDDRTITAPATPEAAAWSGWGTALKPAIEDWWLCRAPLSEKSIAANVLAHGTGALNVDACRYAYGDPAWPGPQDKPTGYPNGPGGKSHHYSSDKRSADVRPDAWEATALGRWPANVIAIPKSSRAERERGCEGLTARTGAEATASKEGQARLDSPRTGAGRSADEVRNHHPTVKPVNLLRWLSRLVTPPGGTVLDPFLGSGTTGVAAVAEGFDFIGIEREPEYMAICEARIRHAARGVGGGDTIDLFRQAPEVVVR